jgi:hypothetical protein
MTTMALFPSYICTLETSGWLIDEMLDFGMRARLPHWRIYDDRTLLPISTVNSVVVFETLNSMAIGALQSPRVHRIIMPVFVNRPLGHWVVFKIWCGGSIETFNSCSSYAAQLPGLTRNIVRILRTVGFPAPQWLSSLATDHQEWPVTRMTCPSQQSGGCGLHCIANACDLLLRGNVQSQTERGDDHSLRVQLIGFVKAAVVQGQEVQTERPTVADAKPEPINERPSKKVKYTTDAQSTTATKRSTKARLNDKHRLVTKDQHNIQHDIQHDVESAATSDNFTFTSYF